MTIQNSSGLSKDDVEKLVREAESNAAEDSRRKEVIENRNNLDNLVYQTEKTISEHGDKLPADEREKLEAALTSAREAKDSDDLPTLKAAFDELTAASHKLAEVMYQSTEAGAEAPGAPSGGGNDSDGDVIDAEFEDA